MLEKLTRHYINFNKIAELSEGDKEVLYALIMQKLPPPKDNPADSEVRLKPDNTKNGNYADHEVEVKVEDENFICPMALSHPLLMFYDEGVGDYIYGIKSRNTEKNAIIGEGSYGKAMELHGFILLDHKNKTVKIIENTENLLVKAGRIKNINSFYAVRNEAAFNNLVYKNTKAPIFSIPANIAKKFVKFYQILQRLPGLSIISSLERWVTKLPTYKTRRLKAKATSEAVHRLHLHGIIHRDLKPENVLFDEKTGKAYVVDFGAATHSQMPEYYRIGFEGTYYYAEPISVLSKYNSQIVYPVQKSTDIRSLMGLLGEIFSKNYRKVVEKLDNEIYKEVNGKYPLNKAWLKETANETAQSFNYLTALNEKYPQFDFTSIDAVEDIPPADKVKIKELLTTNSSFNPNARFPIETVVETLTNLDRKDPVKTNISFGAKLGLLLSLLLVSSIALVGCALIFTGIFTLLGVGLIAAGGVGMFSLLGVSGYAYYKYNKEPIENAQLAEPVLSPLDSQADDVPNNNKVDNSIAEDPYYAPLCKDEEASWEKFNNYIPLEFMLGFFRAKERLVTIAKDNSNNQNASHNSPQLKQ